jgi:two-component system, NtrC family, sensor kinase
LNDVKDSILVVDDRPANRYSTVHALKRAGYHVIEAETGTEALELAKQLPSVILLDVKLPDILGYEVCRRLKANPRTGHIPILQLSAAFVDNESRVYALESGADAYLTQPVEPNVLLATVKSLVKLREAELLATLSSNQWQATFDALSEGVAIFNQARRIQRCNRAMVTLLNSTFAETEGKHLGELFNGSLIPLLGHDAEIKTEELNWEGSHFRIRIEPVFLDEIPNGGIFVLANITGQKLAEQAALMNERLAATGRTANTIAHEINNPLAAITNLLFLLRGEIGSKDAEGYLTSAENELTRVSRITKQILTFHRESAAPILIDLTSLLEDVLALNNPSLGDKRLLVKKEWATEVCVEGFPAQLRQVFSNIVRNAIDASPAGGIIHIRITPTTLLRETHEPAARITISDQGVGIPKRNLGRVFDAFFTTKELKGTGIGLWLSSTIIHEHRGRIQIRSSDQPERSGTCVSVVLPNKYEMESMQKSGLA